MIDLRYWSDDYRKEPRHEGENNYYDKSRKWFKVTSDMFSWAHKQNYKEKY